MNIIRKQILLCTAGTLLEWYDFALFANMTIILSQIFFPKSNHTAALLSTFVVFASGYIARPLGALFFGHYGDVSSRKSALLKTILIMTASTSCIGLIPTNIETSMYLLVVLRLLQGFSTSGEYGGGITMLYEQDSKRKGVISSFGLFSAIMGIFLGTVVVGIVTQIIGQDNMIQWGWRIPFLLAAPFGILGFIIRKSLIESSEFVTSKDLNKNFPAIELLKKYKKNLLSLILIYALGNVCFYINFIYLGNQSVLLKQIDSTTSTFISALVTLGYAASILLFAYLSDFFEKRKMMIIASCLLFAFSYPLFNLILFGNVPLQVIGQLTISLLLGMVVGPLASISAESFKTNVRYSGIGLSLNFAASIFGGTTPLVCAWLTQFTGVLTTPALYLSASAAISVVAILFLRNNEASNADYREIVNSV